MNDNGLSKKLASRRFITVMVVLVMASVLMVTKKLDATNYENIVIWITGIYIIGKPFGDRVSEFLNRINTDIK